jgi:hypothetical protein
MSPLFRHSQFSNPYFNSVPTNFTFCDVHLSAYQDHSSIYSKGTTRVSSQSTAVIRLPSQDLPLSKMAIRKARKSDLQAMAEISAAVFMDEELFGDLMHPHRKEYPEDFILFFKRKFLSHWYDSNRHFLVGLSKVPPRSVPHLGVII